jgi:uncharacterized ferredoxin-like protein
MSIIKTVAELMALAALTAPKARGQDCVNVKYITEPEEIATLSAEMIRYAEETGRKLFQRDGLNVKNSQAVVLLALKNPKTSGLNCGACGLPECSQLAKVEGPEFVGNQCSWRLVDLGIALGSAVKTASIHNVDNRIMYTVGVAARKLKMIEGEVVIGIPLSIGSKNIFFDRPPL